MKHHTLGDLTPQDNGQRPTAPCAECERLRALLQAMPPKIATLTTAQLRAEAERDRYKAALEEITRGEGRYSRDPLTHAENCINAMIAHARTALDAGEPLPNVGTPADVPADGNGGAPDLAQTFAAREARDAVEQPSVEPPSAEAVAWLRELAQWLDCRCGDKQEKQRLGCQLACREYRFVADILRYVEGR